MTAEEREAILEQSRYNGTFTVGRTMFTAGIVNPMIDSAVIASAAKDNGLSFISAVNNGGIYQNRTVMGGNFIFGSSPLDDVIPGLKKLKASATEGSQIFKFKNMTMNYLPEAAVEASGITKEAISEQGLKNIDHVIETGIGFSKDYKPFFNTLSEQGFMSASNSKEGAIKLLQGTGKYSETQIESMRKGFRGSGDYIRQELAKHLESVGTDKVFKNGAEKSKYFASEASRIYGDVSSQSEIIRNRLVKGGGKDVQQAFNSHVKDLDFKGVRQLADDLGSVSGKKIASGSIKAVDFYSSRVSMIDGMLSSGNGKKMASYLSKADVKELALALGHKEKNVSQFYYALKRGKVNIDDAFKAAFNNLSSVKGLRTTLETATKTATKEAGEEIIKTAGKQFFEKTAFQTVMSSTPMKILSGQLVSGALAMPLAITTGAVSALASTHQTAAINNFSRIVNYSTDSIDDMRSEEGQAASYGHKRLSYSNEEDMGYIMNTRNIAEKYMRQVDEIEIDARETRLSSFTTL